MEAHSFCKSGTSSPELAEAMGIREALSWIKSTHWSNVIIETDCLVAVQGIRSSVVMLSYYGRIISDCKDLLNELKYRHVVLRFIKRSANTVAHHLARSTCVVSDRVFCRSNAPSNFISVLANDLI